MAEFRLLYKTLLVFHLVQLETETRARTVCYNYMYKHFNNVTLTTSSTRDDAGSSLFKMASISMNDILTMTVELSPEVAE